MAAGPGRGGGGRRARWAGGATQTTLSGGSGVAGTCTCRGNGQINACSRYLRVRACVQAGAQSTRAGGRERGFQALGEGEREAVEEGERGSGRGSKRQWEREREAVGEGERGSGREGIGKMQLMRAIHASP